MDTQTVLRDYIQKSSMDFMNSATDLALGIYDKATGKKEFATNDRMLLHVHTFLKIVPKELLPQIMEIFANKQKEFTPENPKDTKDTKLPEKVANLLNKKPTLSVTEYRRLNAISSRVLDEITADIGIVPEHKALEALANTDPAAAYLDYQEAKYNIIPRAYAYINKLIFDLGISRDEMAPNPEHDMDQRIRKLGSDLHMINREIYQKKLEVIKKINLRLSKMGENRFVTPEYNPNLCDEVSSYHECVAALAELMQ